MQMKADVTSGARMTSVPMTSFLIYEQSVCRCHTSLPLGQRGMTSLPAVVLYLLGLWTVMYDPICIPGVMYEEVTPSAYQKPRQRKWHSRVHLYTGSTWSFCVVKGTTLSRPEQRACFSPYPDLHRKPVFILCRPAQIASTYHSHHPP